VIFPTQLPNVLPPPGPPPIEMTIDSGIRRIGDWGLGREYVEIKKKIVTWF
jgi:hypothetical protein